MRTILILLLLLVVNMAYSQNEIVVPQLTSDQKQEVLYQHTMAYFIGGIHFAKTKDISPEAYGQFLGKQFVPYWDKNLGFTGFVNQMIYILNGIHPDNDLMVVGSGKGTIVLQLKNVDLMFKNGPAYGLPYKDVVACSGGLIKTIANHMNVTYSQKITEDNWYRMTFVNKNQ